jgi:anti-sigma regulatory factor (Ser/Thr protein kinase)
MREISLHILDIAENAIRAGAMRIEIEVEADRQADTLTVTVRDDGCGMPPEILAGVKDPFVTTRTERKVGLGLPLLAANCEATGGSLDVQSKPGRGTTVKAVFGLSHIDRPPMGALHETVRTLAAGNEERRIVLRVRSEKGEFEFDSDTVKAALDGVPLSSPPVAGWLKEHLREGIAGALDEL